MPDGTEAVLFDLDDTLCTYRRSGADLLATAFEEVGVDPFFEVEEYYAVYERYAGGSGGIRELRARAFADIADDRGRSRELGRKVAAAYAEQRDHSNVEPIEGAEQAIRALSAEYRLGLVTNGSPGMQRRKLSGLPFGDAFETVVFAGYDTAAKPDPEPFERALAELSVEPSRAVHVGNSPSADVDGARGAGIRAALLPDGPATEAEHAPTYTLASLGDLVDPPPWRA